MRPLAWEPPYAVGAARKRQKDPPQKKKKKKKKDVNPGRAKGNREPRGGVGKALTWGDGAARVFPADFWLDPQR